MPCTAAARGHRTSFTPMPGFTLPAALVLPFYDPTNNDPCGYTAINTAGGTSYVADSLCLFHLMFKYGKVIGPPYT